MIKNISLTIALALFLFGAANAQEDNEEEQDSIQTYQAPSVTVTSTRASKRQSPVPFSEIEQEQIEELKSNVDLPQLMNTMPSIYSYSENGNGIGYSNLRLRGFDQRRIAVLINGVPQNDPEDHNVYWINLSDIQESIAEVQVQRGAGLANYGAAAIAGSINLTTTAFINNPGVNVHMGSGYQEFSGRDEFNFNNNKFKFEYSSGMVDDKWAFYAKLANINSFGYRDQSFADLTSWFMSAVRFDDNLMTQVNVYGGSQNDGLSYNGIPKAWTTDPERRTANFSFYEYDSTGQNFSYGVPRRAVAVEDFSSPHYELLNNWEISDNLALKSTLFYFEGEGYFDYSGTGYTDASTYGFGTAYPDATEDPGNPIIRAFVGNKQGGWVPRLVWEHDGGTLTTGAEIRIHRSDHWGKINYAENLPAGYDPNYKFYGYNGERDIYSFFAREQYNLTEDFLLNFEGQVVYHAYRLNNEQFGGEPTAYLRADGTNVGASEDMFEINYLFFNPRFGANWNIDENMNTYVSAAITNREPRMANLYNASSRPFGARPQFARVQLNDSTFGYDFNNPLVKPEQMFNVELGWEYRDEETSLMANLYYMDYADELVKSGQLDIFGAPIDGNAENTLHYGLELEAGRRIGLSNFGNLDLYANLTISRNEIVEYDYAMSSGELISLDGNRIAGFPDLLSSFRVNYSIDNFNLLVTGNYVGSFKTDNFGDLLTTDERIREELGTGYYTDNTVDAYFFLNTNISYRFEDFLGTQALRVKLQIMNLTNNLYAASGEGREFFPGPERNVYLGFDFEF